ncbi:MAG: hypothetical protein AB7V50_09830, partial [Vampirovibrionia bacterium]
MIKPNTDSKIDNFIILLFNDRVLMLLVAMIAPLIIISITNIGSIIDPLIAYLGISISIMSGMFIVQKSVDNPVIPYLPLQMVLLFIFIDKKIMAPMGLNLRLYAIVFAIASAVALYYLVKNFKYLWNTFPLFKYLFIYFVITGFYLLLHYHSDFRTSNDVLSLRYAQALRADAKINSQIKREFGNMAQFVLYIEWLIPIVCTTISLMLFKGLETLDKVQERMITIIKYFTIILLFHFSLASITTAVGLNNRITNIYGENDPGANFFFTMMLLILLGFKYYISNIKFENKKELASIATLIDSAMIYDMILIVFTGI